VPPSASPNPTACDAHVCDRIEDFVARRLDPEAELAFEAHLLVCDECFSAYFLRTVEQL
jgi:putative zinc finger protein